MYGHEINLILNSLEDHLQNHFGGAKKRITCRREDEEFRIRQIYEIEINLNLFQFENLEYFYKLNNIEQIEMFFDEKKRNPNREIESLENEFSSKKELDESIKLKIVFLQKMRLPLRGDNLSFFICDLFDSKAFLKNLILNLRVEDIEKTISKIHICSNKIKSGSSSSIFMFNELDTVNPGIMEYENYIKEIFKVQEFKKRNLTIFPNLLSYDLIVSSELKKRLYMDCLGLIFSYANKDEVHLYNKTSLNISFKRINSNFFDSYYEMCKTIFFIYQDKKYIKEKLLISQNLIYETLSEDSRMCFEKEFWEKVRNNIEHEYKIFVDDKVDSFIKEKKEVIKDQFNLSNQISSQISDLKRGLINNMITIIGIFMSKFFIDALGKSDFLFTSIAIYISTFFSVYLLVLFYITGDFRIEKKYEKRIEIMNTYYPKLFLTKDNLLSDLDDKIISPEVKGLMKVKITCLAVYWLLFLIFSILSLFRLGVLVYVQY